MYNAILIFISAIFYVATNANAILDDASTLNKALVNVKSRDLDSLWRPIVQDLEERNAMSLLKVETMLQAIVESGPNNYESCSEKVTNMRGNLSDQLSSIHRSFSDGNVECSSIGDSLDRLHSERQTILAQLQQLSESVSNIQLHALPPASQQQASGNYTDCSDAQKNGEVSGVTVIYPDGESPKNVFCDQDSFGGGWTVLVDRRRQNPQLGFKKTFNQYKEGFGDPSGEHWIGLVTMQQLTNPEPYELMVTMARGHETAHSFYSSFRVEEGYYARLRVSGFVRGNSTAGDSLYYHDGMRFTTKDDDNDHISGGNCATVSGFGGGWFNACFRANPTGTYGGDRTMLNPSDHFLEWRSWQGKYAYLSELRMMIRPARH